MPKMKWYGVIGVIILAMTAGCSDSHGASGGKPDESAGCGKVSVDRWAATDTRNPDEPAVRLPQPADWKRVNWPDENVRLLIRDDNLGKQLPPSVVVTIADATGKAPNPQALIDTARNNINASAPTDLSEKPATVCGFQGATFTYKSAAGAPAARAIKTIVVPVQHANKLFHVVVTAQAGDAGDDAYAGDARTILTGMEIKAPA
jgi:Probable lipoprotein LpqN